MFKKQRQWIKDHKKEIIVGVVAVGGTALFFFIKDKKINGIRANTNLTLRFLDGFKDDENCWGWRDGRTDVYTSFNMNNPGLAISDLGKLGDLLKEKITNLTDETKLNYLNANYNIVRK